MSFRPLTTKCDPPLGDAQTLQLFSVRVRYEDEINKRAAVENEFVLLKKVRADVP